MINWLLRAFYLWLYENGWYEAELVGDGVTDDYRALQTRLDAGDIHDLPRRSFYSSQTLYIDDEFEDWFGADS